MNTTVTHCRHGTPLLQPCGSCEAETRAARLDAIRQAAETRHTDALVTAGGVVALCELLPGDALAAKLLGMAKPYRAEAAMILSSGMLRGLVRKADDAAMKPPPEVPLTITAASANFERATVTETA